MESGMKRKWSNLDDEDEDEPTLGKQVLPVANLPLDFSGEPLDGLQYLFTVRRDARTLPHVTRAPNPYEVKEVPRAEDPSLAASAIRHSGLPSEEWKKLFLQRFRNFRKNSVQSTIHVSQPQGLPSQRNIPDKKERDAWWAFLSGRPDNEWNPPKRMKVPKALKQKSQTRGMRAFPVESPGSESDLVQTYRLNEEDEVELATTLDPGDFLPTPSSTPAPEAPELGTSTSSIGNLAVPQFSDNDSVDCPREPTPSLLKSIDHRYALHLIMYFSYWINLNLEQPQQQNSFINECHAKWIFVLLSRVDEFVSAEEMSQLRSLARACMGLLKQTLTHSNKTSVRNVYSDSEVIDEVQMGASSWWIIITAVVGIWGQHDLWSDAENVLRELDQ